MGSGPECWWGGGGDLSLSQGSTLECSTSLRPVPWGGGGGAFPKQTKTNRSMCFSFVRRAQLGSWVFLLFVISRGSELILVCPVSLCDRPHRKFQLGHSPSYSPPAHRKFQLRHYPLRHCPSYPPPPCPQKILTQTLSDSLSD